MTKRTPDRLATYQAKRDFSRTAEPSGGIGGDGAGNRFVVQRHRARRRHYDLRLEMDGVLVSWAVPKGPTLDPDVRRLAVLVEDHPLEYIDFEGTIPTGEYGGGDVIVWDRGRWEAVDTTEPRQAIDEGNLHFDLYGEKLAGRFVLVRPKRADSQKQWLLLHKHDAHAKAGWDPEDHPRSVKSGRTNEEVAKEPEALWHSDLPAAQAEVAVAEAPTDDEREALASLGRRGAWKFGGHTLELTNLDKVMAPPGDGVEQVTKRDLVGYYAAIAPVMLPYLVERPVNTHRFPDGLDEPGFWQRRLPDHAPDWLRRWDEPDSEGSDYLVPDGAASLVWLANYGALELHAWTAKVTAPDRPTWTLFDIDPGTKTTFEDVLVLARLHRTALDHLGLVGRPKVTGRRGIQVWVPVEPRYSFAQTRGWAETVSRSIGRTVPDLVSWAWTVEERKGLARLDYTQNGSNKTLVAPYSVRPRPGAPVSVPLEWDELDDPSLVPDRWNIRTVLDRVAEVGDPFAPLLETAQSLPKL